MGAVERMDPGAAVAAGEAGGSSTSTCADIQNAAGFQANGIQVGAQSGAYLVDYLGQLVVVTGDSLEDLAGPAGRRGGW